MSKRTREESKKTAHRLFKTMSKARSAEPSREKATTIDSKNNLAKIARDEPVNTLMLNHYLTELDYLGDDLLKSLVLPITSRNNQFEEETISLDNDEDVNTKKHTVKKHEVIITKLRTTMALIGYTAIQEGKLGKSITGHWEKGKFIPGWLDIIKNCHTKIQILEGKETNNIPENDHINYLGLLLGYDLVEIEKQLAGSQAKSTTKKLGAIAAEIIDRVNQKRLFWVGLGSMITPLTKLLSNTMLDGSKMIKSGGTLGRHAGRMSFILYFIRLPLHLFMLFFKMFDTRNEDEKLPLKARFKAAWAEHGGYIWNDLVWAPVNFITYFWLIGKGSAGFAGNIVTISAFALVDATWGIVNSILSARQYQSDIHTMQLAFNDLLNHTELEIKEDKNKINQNEIIIEENIDDQVNLEKHLNLHQLIQLSNQLIEINVRQAYQKKESEATETAEAIIQQMLAIAFAAKKARFEYLHKRTGYIITTMQGLLNATSIAMMTFTVFPPLLGPIVYISTNILTNLASGANEISKISGKIKALTEEKLSILSVQADHLNKSVQPDLLLAKKLSVINTEISYLQALRTYQKAATFGKVALDLAVTIGVYAAFAFAPFGIGIAIGVGVLALAAILEKIGEKSFKPNKDSESSVFFKRKQVTDSTNHDLFKDEILNPGK